MLFLLPTEVCSSFASTSRITPFKPSLPPAQRALSVTLNGSVATVLLGERLEKFVESSISTSFYFMLISLGVLPKPAVCVLPKLDLEL